VILRRWAIPYERWPRQRLAILGLVSEIVIRRVEPSASAILRRVRLRALLTDPASFGSTYEPEAAFPDQTWAERAARSSAGDDAATLLAISGDEPIGIVTALSVSRVRNVGRSRSSPRRNWSKAPRRDRRMDRFVRWHQCAAVRD
jgi:hypothetical protein